MSRLRTTLRRVPAPLALLLAVAAVLSLSWSLVTAPMQGPDESDHIGFVEHLAETGKIPSATTGDGAYAIDQQVALGTGYVVGCTRTGWAGRRGRRGPSGVPRR